MPKFTFRLGLIDRLYAHVASLINSHLLSKNTLDMDSIADVFDAVDGFWTKHKNSDTYTSNQIRVIVGVIVECLRDNSLDADEVRLITDNVMFYWKPEIAQSKNVEIKPEIEEVAVKAVKVYNKVLPQNISEFVATSTSMISKPLPVDRISEALWGFFR